jgi:sporulation protein YlmC with PRC-barrel domain
MIRNLLATTAIATLLATGAYAQETTAPAPAAPAETVAPAATVAPADGYLASNIIGENVYNGTGDDAEDIGKVNDILVTADGKIQAVVVGVGGFLGIGEKNVAVDFAELDWAEKNGDRWLVAPTTKEQLEALPAFDPAPYEPATVASTDTGAPATDQTANAPTAMPVPAPADQTAQETTPAAPAAPEASGTDATKTGAIDKSTLTEMPAANIRAEEMVGTTVYGADDANVGEIGDVVLTADGKVDAYIIDVGGFLGVGEKEVAVGGDNLAFMTDKDGNKYLYTSFTKEQLDAQAAYDEATYADKRDEQRLTIMN